MLARLARLAALLAEPVRLLLALTPLARLLPRTDHFAPHPDVPFEGYYTRIVTSTNATIIVILSSVRHAPTKPHFVHFSHTPSGTTADLHIEVFPAAIHDIPGHHHRRTGFREFTRVADDFGHCHTAEHVQTYSLRLPDPDTDGLVEIDITLTHRTPWHTADPLSTPEGVFAHLTRLLPLHWNVFSHRSTAQYTIRRSGRPTISGTGTAHVEKNWGTGFPRGWTWYIPSLPPSPPPTLTQPRMQAFSDSASLCLAGGTILRQKAFLIGYRSRKHSCSFAPPTTLLPFELPTPFLAVTHNSRAGELGVTAHNLCRTLKLVIDAVAPPVGLVF